MRSTRSKVKTVPETPVDQIFDGEWEDEQINKSVSPDVEAQPVRIKGLGQDIPDATSDLSESDDEVPHPLDNNASLATSDVPDAEHNRAMPPPPIFGHDIINSAILATPIPVSSSPQQRIPSFSTGKLRRLSQPVGPLYRSPNFDRSRLTKAAGRPQPKLAKPQPTLEPQDEDSQETAEAQVLLDAEPAAKRQKVSSPIRPQTRARSARIRDDPSSAIEANVTQRSAEPTGIEQSARQQLSRSPGDSPETRKPEEAPRQQANRSTRLRRTHKDRPPNESIEVSSRPANHVAPPLDEIEGSRLNPSDQDGEDRDTEELVEQRRESQPKIHGPPKIRSSGGAHYPTGRRDAPSEQRPNHRRTRPQATEPVDPVEHIEQLLGEEATSDEDSSEDEADWSGSDEEDELLDESMFFGQMSRLNHAFKAVGNLGTRRDGHRQVRCKIPRIKTMKVAEISHGCEEVEELMQAEDNQAGEERINDAIKKITTKATSLTRHEKWGSANVTQDVYLHVLPELTRVLQSLLNHYRSRAGSDAQFSYNQLKVARKIMIAVLDVGERLRRVKAHFDPGFPSKNVTRLGIIPNIRDALKSVEQRIRALKQAKVEREGREARARSLLPQQEREGRVPSNRADEDVLRELRNHWRDLHVERRGRALEGKIFISADQDRHLRHVPLPDGVEDPNHEPPGWEAAHTSALEKALQRFAGANVYSDVFRKCCRAGGPLQRYNVSQIVEMAVWLREKRLRDAREQGVEAEPWVVDIPDPRVSRIVSS